MGNELILVLCDCGLSESLKEHMQSYTSQLQRVPAPHDGQNLRVSPSLDVYHRVCPRGVQGPRHQCSLHWIINLHDHPTSQPQYDDPEPRGRLHKPSTRYATHEGKKEHPRDTPSMPVFSCQKPASSESFWEARQCCGGPRTCSSPPPSTSSSQ